jgi:DNA-binding response OmpR family regulator
MWKILLVDDDAVTLEAYGSRLLQAGAVVDTARDGIAALKVLHETKPDLVVLDLLMPKFNGFEVLRYIRGHAELKHIGVVVLSNFYSNDPEHQAAVAEADVTLLKSSCTPALLLEAVNQVLSRGGHQVAASGQPLAPAEPPLEAREVPRPKSEFLKSASLTLATMRQMNDAFVQSDSPQAQGLRLLDFHHKAHAFTGLAATAGYDQIALLSSAFEALLSELHQKPNFITPSTFQTVAQTQEFFRVLVAQPEQGRGISLKPSKVLVVDDDPISARALVAALNKANLTGVMSHDPFQAMAKLEQELFALVLLDIQMPGMDGFEFCQKLRTLPEYARTPVVFVTAHTEFDNRIHGILSGGNDLIGKPIFPIELAVKVVIHLLRSRLPESWDP